MRYEILPKLEKLKRELSLIKESVEIDIKKERVLEHWTDYFPKPLPSFCVASDGSFNKRTYLGFYLYSVGGYAVGYKSGSKICEDFIGDIGISLVKNPEFAESYFRLLMFLVEIKSLLRLSIKEKPDVLLLDGTLSGRFILPPPKTRWFVNKDFGGELAKLSGELIPDIEKNLFNYDITSQSTPIKEKLFFMLNERFGREIAQKRDVFEAAIAKLAYFEYFLLLHYLFYRLDWNPLVIGVAKTSKDTEIFNASIPDISVFHRFISTPGFSKPMYVDIASRSKTIEWEFSEVFEKKASEKANELKDVQIKYFYSKYSKFRVISLIEIYENPERESVSQETINDILSDLSADGYPYPLKRVDSEVRITNRDMEMIEEILGLNREVRGREVVE